MSCLNEYSQIWAVDCRMFAHQGEQHDVFLVAKELNSGQIIRCSKDELSTMDLPPFPTDKKVLVIAFYASAEMNCFLALNWEMPANLLDLFVEFRNASNGLFLPEGISVLDALSWYRLDGLESDKIPTLNRRRYPYTDQELSTLQDHYHAKVEALASLFQAMQEHIDLPRALLRGRFMKAAACIENNGIPMDTATLKLLRQHWTDIQDRLIAKVNTDYNVYEGRTFKQNQFAEYLAREDIPWPRTETGSLDLQDDNFKEMARSYPQLWPLRELRVSLSQMRLENLAVDSDGRNRTLLSAFRSRTGRNQPSTSRFAFGPSVWIRSLIQPQSGYGIAYVDWSQQEFGIAAALSADPLMMEAYRSGDPYLAFAKQSGAVPEDANKKTHKTVRDQFKACVLAVQYGMGAKSLAQRINQSEERARELLKMHRTTYKVFWEWSDAAVDYAMLKNELHTVFGWTIHVEPQPNPRFLRNFPMQANGAEMLRLACCMLTEADIRVCAPVHDAVLIEAPLEELDTVVEQTKAIMAEASSIILGGFRLRSDADVFRHPERYTDERGVRTWKIIMEILEELANA